MASEEAWGNIPGLFGFTYCVKEVKKLYTKEEWAKTGQYELKDALLTAFENNPSTLSIIEQFFDRWKDVLDVMGELCIHPDSFYQYQAWVSPPELKIFHSIIDKFKLKTTQ